MSLPLAAVGALLAALIESSVLPELRIASAQPDLVFVLAIVATMIIGAEDGLAIAFVGGLMLDLLTPDRPLGATTLALLLVTGMAMLAARLLGSARWLPTVVTVFVLAVAYQGILLGLLAVTAGVSIVTVPLQTFLVIAVLDVVVAALAALGARSLALRFAAERDF